ncbi:tetratricopeptide repeat protein [Methanolobus bombayensis]|uniref:tetratricopeptide repeat protein n=1 Tax=Methanolobus bombayensis TaxID=38023 RepID=UPI001AE11049|nr:tetratricopeptide (TPR) repeat protein [Methanolobus bombayensis]
MSELKKYLKNGFEISLFLNDGKVVKGFVEDIGDSYIIVRNGNWVRGINIHSINMWEMETDYKEVKSELATDFKPCVSNAEINVSSLPITADETIENLGLMAELNKLTMDFNKGSTLTGSFQLKDMDICLPSNLNFSGSQEHKKTWEKVNNQYRDALKNNNLSQLSYLAEELSTIAAAYPYCGIFNYKAGMFLSMINDNVSAAIEFMKAFLAEDRVEFIYNAACASLYAQDVESAYRYFGIYFNFVLPSMDLDAWITFCLLGEKANDFYIFSKVVEHNLMDLNNKDLEMRNNWNLLIRSLIFVLYKRNDYKKAAHLKSLMDMVHLEKDQISQMLVSSFSGLNIISCEEYEDILGKVSSRPSPPDDGKNIPEDMCPEIASESRKTTFMSGNIYAFKNEGYGFIRDSEGIERYFYHKDIIDEGLQSELSSVRWGNEIPVLFEPSKGKEGQAIAVKILSQIILDNIIKLAEAFAKEEDFVSALSHINEAIELDPDNITAVDLREKWKQVCKSELNKGSKRFSLNPTTTEEWYDKGVTHLQLGQYDEALMAFEHSSEKSSSLSSICHAKGVAYFNSRRYDEALECFVKALEINPLNHRTWFGQGCCLMRKGEFAESLKYFEKAIEFRVDFEEAWTNKAISCFLLENYYDSIHAFDRALQLNPDNFSAWSWKAAAHLKKDQYQEAYFSVSRSLDIAPYHAESMFCKGYILSKEGNLEEALHWFERSLSSEPYNIKALTKKAFVLSGLNRNDEALEDIEAALELGRDNPKTWYYKGVILMNTGEYEQALEALERSLDIQPDVERVIRSQQTVLMKLGRNYDENLVSDLECHEDKVLEDFMADSCVSEIKV